MNDVSPATPPGQWNRVDPDGMWRRQQINDARVYQRPNSRPTDAIDSEMIDGISIPWKATRPPRVCSNDRRDIALAGCGGRAVSRARAALPGRGVPVPRCAIAVAAGQIQRIRARRRPMPAASRSPIGVCRGRQGRVSRSVIAACQSGQKSTAGRVLRRHLHAGSFLRTLGEFLPELRHRIPRRRPSHTSSQTYYNLCGEDGRLGLAPSPIRAPAGAP